MFEAVIFIFRAGTTIFSLTVLFISNILVQILFSGSDYFLQYWTKNEEKYEEQDKIEAGIWEGFETIEEFAEEFETNGGNSFIFY